MHYEVSRRRLYNSPEDHPYCLTIFLENGIKAQYPVKSESEGRAQYGEFLDFQGSDLHSVDDSQAQQFSERHPCRPILLGCMRFLSRSTCDDCPRARSILSW
ncbi:MAG: hypothetical protein ACFE0I_02340 [Elainellaceae cyanobacterium]